MSQPRAGISYAFLLLLTVFTLAGCRSAGIDIVEQHEAPADGGQQPGFGAFLPSPRALLEGQEQVRSASFSEEDFIKYGGEFDPLLPNQNALPAPSNSVEFQPSWSDANGKDASKLAYCIYKFTIPDYDRGAELRYGWGIAPPEVGTVWFGLSHWQHDTWDWLPGEGDGVSSFGTAEPYFNGSDEMYVVVVCANDDMCVMRYLRVGDIPANIVLEVTPRYSSPPVHVVGNAVGSTMPVGTIEQYEWDWDNDGAFEENTGTSPYSSSNLDAIGEYMVSVRVTSSYGEQATASDSVSVIGPWTHSWGTDLYQDIGGIAADNSEFCYSAGSIMRSAGHRDALLMKHSLGGPLVWVAAWGGADYDDLEDVEFTEDGIFAVGQTKTYGAGNEDILIQRWDVDGNVVWSRVWGTAGIDRGAGLALTDDAVYVAGASEAMGDMDVLLLKYDLDGIFKWARTWGGTGYDVGTDIASYYADQYVSYSLHVTGATSSPSPLYQDVLYLETSEDASVVDELVWRSDTQDHQFGEAIAVYGDGQLPADEFYIAGSIGDSGQREALLLQFTGLARSWSNSTECVAYGIVRSQSAGKFYIAGRGWDLGLSSGGFVLDFSESGSLQNSVFWADGDDNTGITALHAFPGSGLLVGGNCKAADLGSWAGTSGAVTDPGGAWSPYSGTVNVPVGSMGSPTTAAVKVTSGVVDVGGGDGWDALLSIVQFP